MSRGTKLGTPTGVKVPVAPTRHRWPGVSATLRLNLLEWALIPFLTHATTPEIHASQVGWLCLRLEVQRRA